MDTIKKYLPHSMILMLGIWIGFYIGTQYYPRIETKTVSVEKPIIVQGEAKTETKTEIAYIPKETTIIKYIDVATGKEITTQQQEVVDLDAQIGKTEFVVKINDKNAVFHKNDDEKYMFERNKLALSQSSIVTIDAHVQPQKIDETRRWSVGVGYGDHGMAYKIDFPLKYSAWSGWIYKDNESRTGGIAVNF